MYRPIDKADPSSLRESTPHPFRRVRDDGGSAPSNLAGWLLWVYVGLLVAALAALMGPPVYRWLRAVGGAL